MEDSSTREQAREILDTMLGYLGFMPTIDDDPTVDGVGFQVAGGETDKLIGDNGRTLDDLQYLLNRFLNIRHPDAGRVRLDIHFYRVQQESEMIEQIQTMAEAVRNGGQPITLRPMNSYDRRLVHNAFAEDPHLESWSPGGRDRLKRITIRPKR